MLGPIEPSSKEQPFRAYQAVPHAAFVSSKRCLSTWYFTWSCVYPYRGYMSTLGGPNGIRLLSVPVLTLQWPVAGSFQCRPILPCRT